MTSFSSIYRSWSRWRWPATLGSRSAAAAGAGRRGSTLPTAIERLPVENAYVESFIGKLRNECLSENWFLDLHDARRIIEAWRVDYNEVRPHSSPDGMTPKEYAKANRGLTLQVA